MLITLRGAALMQIKRRPDAGDLICINSPRGRGINLCLRCL